MKKIVFPSRASEILRKWVASMGIAQVGAATRIAPSRLRKYLKGATLPRLPAAMRLEVAFAIGAHDWFCAVPLTTGKVSRGPKALRKKILKAIKKASHKTFTRTPAASKGSV
jgi:transcriptional regulator with XRE-family HTH domain